MKQLHSGHMGIVKCRERAKQKIQVYTESYTDCQTTKPAQRREPLMTTPLPDRPWMRVAADICEGDRRNYLVVVDYFSRFIDIAYFPDMSGNTVRLCLSNMFARWGCPNALITDNSLANSFETSHKLMVSITSP
ncbi:hypothetical protein PGIGA_G00169220 [Pangasianodon gigas]|uniref:Uncharacterized protein n=1 Tax=Pangasianodon gigas TaxID=30993 RepID=A0ACC5XT74_PANGG|nr:hypothetical protein [Pangasianodon gigas]